MPGTQRAGLFLVTQPPTDAAHTACILGRGDKPVTAKPTELHYPYLRISGRYGRSRSGTRSPNP